MSKIKKQHKLKTVHIDESAGFIALISVLIITSVLLAVTFSLGFSSFMSRFDILDSEFKEKSAALAEACADIAIIRLQANPTYTPLPIPGDVVSVGAESCNIWLIAPAAAWPKTIKTQGIYPLPAAKKSYTNLEISVSKPADRVIVNSWKEITNLP